MKQERISVLEDVNYESWTIKTLKRFARAFDLRLSIKFESFGSFLTDYDSFSRDNLKRLSFDEDPAFHSQQESKDDLLTARRGTGKTSQFLRIVNTAPSTVISHFKGDPIQAKFSFMDQSRSAISEVLSTPTLPPITVEDFKRANIEFASLAFVSKNVEEAEEAA